MTDVGKIQADLGAGNYTTAGVDASDIVNLVFGPVAKTSEEYEHPEDLIITFWGM